MRPWMEKWGSVLLIFLCALVIVFSALYTRQDDLRRIAAHNAAASQDETLENVSAVRLCAPVAGEIVQRYTGAYKGTGGLWQMDPFVHYAAARGDRIVACCDGMLVQADAETIVLHGENNREIRLRGSFDVRVSAPCAVTAGQTIAAAAATGEVLFAVRKDMCYVDPLSLITP